MGDRHALELQYMRQFKDDDDENKSHKQKLIDPDKKLGFAKNQENINVGSKLRKQLLDDGLYVDGSLEQRVDNHTNTRKLDERLLYCNQGEYFKANGQVKMNNDILADELTRPSDIAFEQSDAYQVSERNAIITDRLNSFKKQYYQIDITIGKILLKRHEKLFSEEDHLCLELRDLLKTYDRRVCLALIPFYLTKKDYIEDEIASCQKDGNRNMEDEKFLKKVRKNIQRSLDEEVRALTEAAKEILALWKRIQDHRKAQKEGYKEMTPYKLQVYQGSNEEERENGAEVLFNLKDDTTFSDEDKEKLGINKVENTKAYCKLIIDGKEVKRTDPVKIAWPAMELQFMDKFQIFVFTLPSKV